MTEKIKMSADAGSPAEQGKPKKESKSGERMVTIKLQDVNALRGEEHLPEVPELVQRYLDLKESRKEKKDEDYLRATGENFRIVIQKESRDSKTAGMAYLNELRIEKRDGEKWSQVYSTGMKQYRGAYNYERDNWSLSMNDPIILEESKSNVTYAFRNGAGDVEVKRFRKGSPEYLESFSVKDYEATQKRLELLKNVVNDSEAFRSYVAEGLGNYWHTASEIGPWEGGCKIFDAAGREIKGGSEDEIAKNVDVAVLLARHSDRDYDAITDRYKFFLWVKGKGLGVTDEYSTGLYHPGGKFYSVGLDLAKSSITTRDKNFVNLTAEVGNRQQKWAKSHNFRVKW